jgi:hypothetical protein
MVARVTLVLIGGEGEIRTHEPRKGPPVFKTGAFNRSATSPYNLILPDLAWPCVAPRAAHSAHLRNATSSFYNFFVRSLMAHDDGSLDAARVRIDGSGSRDFQRALNSYLRRMLGNKLKEVKMSNSESDPLMQLADVCIGVMCQRLAFRLTKEKAPFRGLLSCDPAF